MPMKVRYTVANGEIIAEKRNGVRRTYVPDPLGSTVALLDNNQQKTDTFSYWPYGEVKTRTGNTPTPFQYVGTLGYYRDSTGRTYVRARHYQQRFGRWMSADPLITVGPLYKYSLNNPTSVTDRTGLYPWNPLPPTDEACKHYLDKCREGYIYACNAWKLCMATGDSKAANCVRGCLLCALKERSLGAGKTCWELYLDHLACMKICGYSNQCFDLGGFSAFRSMCEKDYQPGFWETAALRICGYDPIPELPKGVSEGTKSTLGTEPSAPPGSFVTCSAPHHSRTIRCEAKITWKVCNQSAYLVLVWYQQC